MAVPIEDIVRIVGLRVVLLGEVNSEPQFEGVVVPTPRDEKRAEYCLSHNFGQEPQYINIYPEKVESIEWRRNPVALVMPPTYGGGRYFNSLEANIASKILEQHNLLTFCPLLL